MAQIRAMDWDRYVGQMVRVYRNLNNGRISVQAYAEGDWRVVAHVQDIVLECVSFSLREAARQRAVAQNQRNVHAWAEGRLIGQVSEGLSCPIALGYNYRLAAQHPEFSQAAQLADNLKAESQQSKESALQKLREEP